MAQAGDSSSQSPPAYDHGPDGGTAGSEQVPWHFYDQEHKVRLECDSIYLHCEISLFQERYDRVDHNKLYNTWHVMADMGTRVRYSSRHFLRSCNLLLLT